MPGKGACTTAGRVVIAPTKHAALELRGSGIRADAIALGPANTDMYRSVGQKLSMGIGARTLSREGADAAQDAMPNPLLPLGGSPALGPESIPQTAPYLASDLSGDVSGAVLDTALGYTA